MEEIRMFKLCPDYKRVSLDFNEIQREKTNPLDKKGYPIYPRVLPSSQGTSYTYQISDDWFFKRKLQDGNNPAQIFSQHHHKKTYDELSGSFDDLAEVICYILAKNIINPTTGEKIIDVAEYKLATFTDENDILYRGCISKNICNNPGEKIVTMAEILSCTGIKGNSITDYMSALEKYTKARNITIDLPATRTELIKHSFFCWKVANSDNHKNNIIYVFNRNTPNGPTLRLKSLIDNGSAYELSSPYTTSNSDHATSRFEQLLYDDNFSVIDENGQRHFAFSQYPFMHNAFHLDVSQLLFNDVKIGEKSFSYEYCLASEILSDPELYESIYQIETQFDLDKAIAEIDDTYGKKTPNNEKLIDWPPLLKEYMYETNRVKSETLSTITADYYLYAAFSKCIGTVDREKPSDLYENFRKSMISLPLLPNKKAYDLAFTTIAQSYGVEIDTNLLESLAFKKSNEFSKPENQPS